MSHRLHLFGVIHFDRLSKVDAELTEYLENTDADAIFIEQPSGEGTRRMVVNAIFRTPVVFLGILFLNSIVGAITVLFNRRLMATEHIVVRRLSERYPVHEVDRSVLSYMADSGVVIVLLNWALICGFFFLIPVRTATTIAVVLAGGAVINLIALRSRRLAAIPTVLVAAGFVALIGFTHRLETWFLAVTVVAFGVFVKQVHDSRNQHMVERITTITEEEGYGSSVLVTGRAHLSGLSDVTTDADLTLARTYSPRWLRAPGKIDEDPAVESADSPERRPVTPGSIRARAVASLVDFVVFLVLLWIPGLGLAAVSEGFFDGVLPGFFIGVFLTPIVYHAAFEAAFGWTIGKRLTRLVVTNTDGSSASLRACLLRNLFRPVDSVVFYLVGALAVALTERHQRLGDLVAGTEVRRAR